MTLQERAEKATWTVEKLASTKTTARWTVRSKDDLIVVVDHFDQAHSIALNHNLSLAALTSACEEKKVDGIKEAEADETDLAAITHIPDSKLRNELAVCNAELEKAHRLLDKHEGIPDGMTSLETLSDRLAILLKIPVPACEEVKKEEVK